MNCNIDNLTFGQIKEIAKLAGNVSGDKAAHPLIGKKVLVVIQHGFIFFGTLTSTNGYLTLSDASNIRYWQTRTGGLQELIEKGTVKDDKIDKCSSSPVINEHLFIQEIVRW